MTPDPPTIVRGRGRSVLRAGTLFFAIGVLLVLAPLVLGRGMLNKYIVTLGLLAACLGLTLLLNGLIDRFFARR